MVHYLGTWQRFCIFFGLYIKSCDTDEWVTAKGVAYKLTNTHIPCCVFLNKKHDSLKLGRLYICLIALAICVLYVHGIYRHGPLPNLLLTWLTSAILFHFQVLTNLLILMETVCRRTQHESFLLLLDEIELSLKLRLRANVRKCELMEKLQHLLAYLGALSFFGLVLFMITTIWLNYIGYFWNGLWSILTLRARIIQLLLYIRMLQHYLECLCVKLQQIVAYRLAPQQQLLDIDYGKLCSVEYLLAIKEICLLIHKAFELLNAFAGWSLFGIVITFMLDISFNAYWTFMSLDGFLIRKHYYIAGPLAIIPRIVIIFLLCYWCNKCKELGQNLNQLVSRIQILSSIKAMQSYRLVLQQLSTQLQLQHIEITAHGFFVLEMRLLLTIFIEIATNLIILVQFLSVWFEYVYGTKTLDVTDFCHNCLN